MGVMRSINFPVEPIFRLRSRGEWSDRIATNVELATPATDKCSRQFIDSASKANRFSERGDRLGPKTGYISSPPVFGNQAGRWKHGFRNLHPSMPTSVSMRANLVTEGARQEI
jgi:hypothetical protein